MRPRRRNNSLHYVIQGARVRPKAVGPARAATKRSQVAAHRRLGDGGDAVRHRNALAGATSRSPRPAPGIESHVEHDEAAWPGAANPDPLDGDASTPSADAATESRRGARPGRRRTPRARQQRRGSARCARSGRCCRRSQRRRTGDPGHRPVGADTPGRSRGCTPWRASPSSPSPARRRPPCPPADRAPISHHRPDRGLVTVTGAQQHTEDQATTDHDLLDMADRIMHPRTGRH